MSNIKHKEKPYSKFLVIAPMSSGKSTLINALLGKRLLQTSNFACTSKEFQIVINDHLENTQIFLRRENGTKVKLNNNDNKNIESQLQIATQQPYKEILIETNSQSTIASSKPVMLIDTPGANYSQNINHQIITEHVLEKFDNGTIIYVLNATQIGTEDDFKILSTVRSHIRNKNIKLLFVLSKIDELDPEKEQLNDFINNVAVGFLGKLNIKTPIIFPCASEAALLFKCAINEEPLSESESDKLYKYYKLYYNNSNHLPYTMYNSKIPSKSSEVLYDGELYSLLNISSALMNTGIYELEQYISKMSTEPKMMQRRKQKMNKVYIKYNPYTVKTEFRLDGKPIDKLSTFYDKQENIRFQEWIEPSGEWEGLFSELHKYFNSSEELEIDFQGTLLDFQDLQYACDKYGSCFEHVTLHHIQSNDQKDRLRILKEQFEKVQHGPVAELRDPKIQESFEKALSSEFEVVVIAPMSSGKSTLINSILGTNLLPEANQATTATITRVKAENGLKTFRVSCKDRNGKVLASDQIANLDCITHLNQMADKQKNINSIDIRGSIPTISSNKVNIVFVDTPGGNNSQDETHKEIMKRAIRDENKGMILFVFNFTQLGTTDCDAVLELAAQSMKDARTGKQSRDRFMFVCNKMDEQDPEKEPMDQVIKHIKEHLNKKGITDPNLFLTDARVCKLVRMAQSKIKMTDSEEDKLDGLLRPFNRETRKLFKYASISEEKKKEFQEELDKIAKTGEIRNLRAAEINSGIPALEYAITQYIEKYAQAIKIKTVHDIFMKRVEELDMKAKCRDKWSSSHKEYEKMHQELAAKRKILEKDKKLEEFKNKIDALEADYSAVETIKEYTVEKFTNLSYDYPEKVKESNANAIVNRFYNDLINMGTAIQEELDSALDNCIYKQCRQILQEYKHYLLELDRLGVFELGDYSFKKTEKFNILSLENLENVAKKVIKHKPPKYIPKEKKGIVNAIKRFFHNENGWEKWVLVRDLIHNITSPLSDQFLNESDNQIQRAKEAEKKIKEFAKKNLTGIKQQVATELKEIEIATADEKKLKDTADKNRENMEWLSAFVKEMSEMLDV